MRPPLTTAILIAAVAALFTIAAAESVVADESLADPAHATLGWTLWGDDGDRALSITPVDDFAPDDRYADPVTAIQQAVERIAGIELPVIGADSDPREVLGERPVIALGNMATSHFMHELYREYYTWLDLRYPGPGGSVVRSRPRGSRFIRDVLVADINGDGTPETVVGLQNGWLVCIEADGDIAWSRKFTDGVRRVAAVDGGVVAGLVYGQAILLDPDGTPVRAIAFEGPVRDFDVFAASQDGPEQIVLAGGDDGRLVALPR